MGRSAVETVAGPLYNLPHEVDMLLDAVRHIAQHSADYRTTPA